VRRRILGVAVLAVVLAVGLFGIPLAIAVGRLYTDEESSELERVALRTAVTVPSDVSTDPTAIRIPNGDPSMHVAIYDTKGRRVAGDGPAVGDLAVARALRGRVTDVHDEGVVIVAVPVTSNKQVVAVARAASSPGEVRGRTLGAWAAMTGLALLAGVIASFIAAVQARRLTRPLQHLEAVAEDLGAGDFSTRAEPSGVGEIDRTGQALNVTAQRLDDLLARERAFTAQASHQLRTPLTSLRLGLESALQNDGDLRAAAHEAIVSADQLSQTVDDVLALTRGTSTGSTPLDLPALLAEVRSRWEAPLSSAGRTLVVIEETPPTAAAAEPAVRQILEVLLDNAFRHGKGTVTVTARDGGGALAIDVVDEGHAAGTRPLVPVQDEQSSPPPEGGHRMGLRMASSLARGTGGRLLHAHTEPQTRMTLLLVATRD
jgi:signal transduction histidine kinase